MKKKTTDTINPPHYKKAAAHPSGVECIEITRKHPFTLGNAFKYMYRAGAKDDTMDDYAKAAWYLRDFATHVTPQEAANFFASNALLSWADKDAIIEKIVTSFSFGYLNQTKAALVEAADALDALCK